MRLTDPTFDWICAEVGLSGRRSRRTRHLARRAWVDGYTVEAIAAEAGIQPQSVRRALLRLEKRIRAHQALLDEGEPIKGVLRGMWEPDAGPEPFSRQARHLRECVANRQVQGDHSPPVSHNTYTGVPEVVPQHPPACSQREAEIIVRDLAWFREKVRGS